MILALLVLVPLVLGAGLVYFRFRPNVEEARRRDLLIFDTFVVVLILMFCGSAGMYFRVTTGQSVDRAWRPILTMLSCLLVTFSVLLIAALVRNLNLFRTKG